MSEQVPESAQVADLEISRPRVRLAIADPPYPPIRAAHPRNDSSRARRWYDRDYRKSGDARFASDHHEDAGEWDKPETHRALMDQLESEYDGWVIATSHDGVPVYGVLPRCARIAIWVRPNGGAGAARIRNAWEPVIVRPPTDRLSSRLMGGQIADVLVCPSPRVGFAGAKPPQWTRWVLDMLGHDPETDERHRRVPGLRHGRSGHLTGGPAMSNWPASEGGES